ncbi:MAG: excinuclease ABC subunit UvrC [Thermodesulfobacteriota bacterium]
MTPKEPTEVINAEFLRSVAREPGVYIMYDWQGRAVYVGKAVNLRKRLASYVRRKGGIPTKTAVMLGRVASVETIITRTDKEAFILEASLIKEYRPRYNVRLKDDKSYPYIKVTVQEKWPRLLVTRKKKKDGSRYFGPYSSASTMKATLKFLNSLFPLRRCKKKDVSLRDRPCLNFQMGRCIAPCSGNVDEEKYQEMVSGVLMVLEGRDRNLVRVLKEKMTRASDDQRFEEAAFYRDQINALSSTLEKQLVAGADCQDREVIGFARRGTSAAVAMLTVKKGQVSGQHSFFLAEPLGKDGDILTEVIRDYFDGDKSAPREIALPFETSEPKLLSEYLGEKSGIKVRLKVPKRGDLRKLVEIANCNARQVFEDQDKKEKSWQATAVGLAERLQLSRKPHRIECLDISNISGSNAVGSLVSYRHGSKDKKRYRHYNIKSVAGPDDYAMMAEVIGRRLKKGVEAGDLPDLLLVDGGKGQLNIVSRVLEGFDLTGRIEVAGIAKERQGEGEKIYRPGRKNPVKLTAHSPLLLLLMQIRDEAHRFAISFHRRQRQRKTFVSELDDIPGIGRSRKEDLLKELGSLKRIRNAGIEDLEKVPGIGRGSAARIYRHFHR